MRYEVKDHKGKWHASYNKNIPSYSAKDALNWAKQTAKHINGIVYEVIIPNSPQYPTKTIELFNYSYSNYKGNKKNKKKTFDKKDNKRDDKKDK